MDPRAPPSLRAPSSRGGRVRPSYSPPDLQHLAGLLRHHRRGAIAGPRLGQGVTLLEHVGALVGALGLVADPVSERQFGHLARKIRLLRTPVAERAPETVH